MNAIATRRLLAVSLVVALGACGGGEPQSGGEVAQLDIGQGVDNARATALSVSDSQRIAAAIATASSQTNYCGQIRPFYWELGNGQGRLASGSLVAPNSTQRYTSTTAMAIASASKWIYGAYVTQRNKGVLGEADLKFLEMRSGYVSFDTCAAGQTVDGCLNDLDNGAYSAQFDGSFEYDGGHMQKHASMIGLGGMNSRALANEIMAKIGTDVKLAYATPQLAGGVLTSADAYGKFLRKMLVGKLELGRQLGSAAVCTSPASCGSAESHEGPVTEDPLWHYSIGHWVEDDPITGDGAYSSGGSYGFYPWIDASRTTYGIIARVAQPGSGRDSAKCGRLIRDAWVTATAR